MLSHWHLLVTHSTVPLQLLSLFTVSLQACYLASPVAYTSHGARQAATIEGILSWRQRNPQCCLDPDACGVRLLRPPIYLWPASLRAQHIGGQARGSHAPAPKECSRREAAQPWPKCPRALVQSEGLHLPLDAQLRQLQVRLGVVIEEQLLVVCVLHGERPAECLPLKRSCWTGQSTSFHTLSQLQSVNVLVSRRFSSADEGLARLCMPVAAAAAWQLT